MKNITTKLKNIKPVYLVAALVIIAVAVMAPMQKQITKLFSDAAQTDTFLMGDVDGNGKVEPSDARTVLRAAVQLEALEGVENGEVLPNDKAVPTKGQLADIDGDGKITPADARAALRMAVNLDAQKTFKQKDNQSGYEIDIFARDELYVDKNGDIVDENTGDVYGKAEDYADANGTITKIPLEPIKDKAGNTYIKDEEGHNLGVNGSYFKIDPEGEILGLNGEVIGYTKDYGKEVPGNTAQFSEFKLSSNGEVLLGKGSDTGIDSIDWHRVEILYGPDLDWYPHCETCGRTDCLPLMHDYTCPVCGQFVPALSCHPESHANVYLESLRGIIPDQPSDESNRRGGDGGD